MKKHKEELFSVKKDEVLNFKIPFGTNRVLLKTTMQNVGSTTASGIIKSVATDIDWNPAVHASRWGEVVAFPSGLKFTDYDGTSLSWQTEIEIHKGMMVWYDYLDSLNSPTYVDEEGTEYKMIEYANLYVGLTDNEEYVDKSCHSKTTDGKLWVVPLNGYILFTKVNKMQTNKIDLLLRQENDPSRGKARFISKPNKRYSDDYSDDLDVGVGDLCLFSYNYEVMLEDPYYAVFDGGNQYKRNQRRHIEMVWKGEEILIPKGRAIIRQDVDSRVTQGGVELMVTPTTHDTGEVLQSRIISLKEGDKILYSKGAGRLIDYKGERVRLIKEGNVYCKRV